MQKDPLSWLYPPIEPFRIHRLRVSDLHELYVEESGNPNGAPVIFLHGGPGGGTSPKHRRFFDPRKYRIILFDQRGCGQSTPYAEVRENTTWDLVADIERIRHHLGVERWQVFGGSWGSTLALAYAEKHPQQVSSLVLRGIFLLREWELRWFYQEGASRIFPEAFAAFRDFIPESERGDLAAAYAKRLFSDDPAVNLPAAKAWSIWEGSASKLLPDESFTSGYGQDATTLAFARIECHYFMHKGWLEGEDQLLRDAPKLKGIPGVIVQGRYDIVCPAQNAWDLHQAWPDSELVIVPDAGHSATEWGVSKALVAATDRLAAGGI